MYLNNARTVSNSVLSGSQLVREDRIGRNADKALARKYIKKQYATRVSITKVREMKTVLFLIVELAVVCRFLRNNERIIRFEKRPSKIMKNNSGSLLTGARAEAREDG